MFASLPQQTIALMVLATTAAPGQANSSPLRFWGCLFSLDSAKRVVLERGIKIANAEGGDFCRSDWICAAVSGLPVRGLWQSGMLCALRLGWDWERPGLLGSSSDLVL